MRNHKPRKKKEKISRQLTIVTDRSQGVSSIKDGSLEIMLHRRILFDDGLGVAEHLNETGSNGLGLIVKGNLYLIFDSGSSSAKIHRDLAHRINNKPLITFATNSENKHIKKMAGLGFLKYSLPDNVHILTFKLDYDDLNNDLKNSIIIRLENFYELDEDPLLSQTVTVDLQKMFSTIVILGYEELALGANTHVKTLEERLKWNTEDDYLKLFAEKYHKKLVNIKGNYKKEIKSFEVTLAPMQIRTFRMWFNSEIY